MKKAMSENVTPENIVLEALNLDVRVRERPILQNILLRVASGEILAS